MRTLIAPLGLLFTIALAATACSGGGGATPPSPGGGTGVRATPSPGATASPSPAPTATPVQTSARTHLVVGDANLVTNNMAVYTLPMTAGSTPAFFMSTPNGDPPISFCVDKSGDLFAVSNGEYVYVYSPPYSSGTQTVSSWATRYRTVRHYGCAVDPVQGNLVVGTAQANTVEIYQPPLTSPTVFNTVSTNTNFAGATGGLAFDSSGNLAANENYTGTSVHGFGMAYAAAPFSASSAVTPFGQSGSDDGLVFDRANNLINPSGAGLGMDVYTAPVTSSSTVAFTVQPPSPDITFWGWAAVDTATPQNLYVAVRDSRASFPGVAAVAVYTLPLSASSQPAFIVDVPGFAMQTNNQFGVAIIP
jgi:hypothetical protein